GVAGYTPLVFDASASIGTGLRYLIDFGDGSSSTNVIATHVGVQGEQSRVARLTVTDAVGRTASAEAPYYLLSVRPSGVRPGGGFHVAEQGTLSPSLVQDGKSVSGRYSERGPTHADLPFTGTLIGDRTMTLRTEDGSVVLEGNFAWRTVGC